MIIYRLEGDSGYGAINHNLTLNDKDSIEYNNILYQNDHIFPFEYAGNFDNFEMLVHYFGCSSMEQLNLWFSDDVIEKLKPFGVSLVMYEIDEKYVTKTDVQVMFEMRYATKLNEETAACTA